MATYRSGKTCGGFQPEFCLEWRLGAASTEILISLECGEVKRYGPPGELYCDLAPEAVRKLKHLLSPYQGKSHAEDPGE